jgi:hypothetical protein
MSHPAPALIRGTAGRPAPALLAAAAFAALATAVPAAATPTVFDVADRTQLAAALGKARPGDTIRLAGGDYGAANWDRIRFTGGHVTIRSADPANRARFGQLLFGNATGIALAGVDIQTSLSPAVSISGSDIIFAGNRIRGVNLNSDPWDDSNAGMHVRFAERVTIASNEWQDLRVALYIQRSEDIAVRHNSFTHLREGVNVATVLRGTFDNNLFHSFSPNYGKGEHPDAIQFWNRNEPSGSREVKLRNNFFSLGTKGAIHGIFLGTEHASLPHSGFEISGNVYYGSALHGISLAVVNDTQIFNNVVVASPWADLNDSRYDSADGREGGAMQPHIRLGSGSNVHATRNVATILSGSGTGRTFGDNINLFDTQTGNGEPWDSVFAAGRISSALPPLSAFVSRVPSLAATRGIGLLAPFAVGATTLDPVLALGVANGAKVGVGLPVPIFANQPVRF